MPDVGVSNCGGVLLVSWQSMGCNALVRGALVVGMDVCGQLVQVPFWGRWIQWWILWCTIVAFSGECCERLRRQRARPRAIS